MSKTEDGRIMQARIVNKDDDVSLRIDAAAVSGRSEKRNFGNGLNHLWEDTFCQTFLIHSQSIYIQIFDAVLDLI